MATKIYRYTSNGSRVAIGQKPSNLATAQIPQPMRARLGKTYWPGRNVAGRTASLGMRGVGSRGRTVDVANQVS
jgi:hypothetical protein